MQIVSLGICISLFGTTFVAIGLLIQKYAHKIHEKAVKEDFESTARGRPYFLQPWWLLGISVFAFGHIICYVALGFVAQTVLSCLNVWTMVVTMVLAPMLLGEQADSHKMLSVTAVITGVVFVVAFGPTQEPRLTVDGVLESLHSTAFLQFTSFTLCLGLGPPAIRALFSHGVRGQTSAVEFALLAAIIAWYSVLCAKCSSALLLSPVHDLFADPVAPETKGVSSAEGLDYHRLVPWIFLSVMAVLALSNVHFMNMALRRGDAVLVVPIYQSLSTFGEVLLGGLFFQEFETISGGYAHHLCFYIGLSLGILGNLLLTWKQPAGEQSEQEAVTAAVTIRKQGGNYSATDDLSVTGPCTHA